MKRIAILSGVLAVLCASASPSWADKLTRKSDSKPLNGDVTAATKEQVTIKDGVGKSTTVETNDVVTIEWAAGPSTFPLGLGAEKGGKFDAAIENYNSALKDPKAKGNILGDIEFAVARTLTKQGLGGDSAKLDDGIKKLEAFLKARAEHYRYYEAATLLGDALTSKKDYEGAAKAYERLAAAKWPDYKLAAKLAAGRVAVAKNDLATALSTYEEIANSKGDTPAEVSKRNFAIVGKASVMVAQKKHDDALKVITGALETLNADDPEAMAEAYVLQGDCLQSQNKIKEAILAYLHVPVLFENQREMNARALFNLAQLWAKVDQPDRAQAATQTLKDDYSDTTWAKQLQ